MADIPLRTYVQQLDHLIDRKNVDEAVAHSRHILGFYPKHLDTYRMLGKALLEKGRHGDAADVFQRVLSVLPDDFISHVGMAIVREDEANLDDAIWHMERAFEAMPSNGAIQQELCRLYGRRDGVVPPKARLTRGALGRMYCLGGLYLQAEAELQAALAADPERIDLQTVLAQVYWYSEQHEPAAQLCGAIAQRLPYSQVANRVLRAIFHARRHDADAALYRQRLEALDPYEAFASPAGDGATLTTADLVEAEKILVTRLEYVAGMESAGGPDWIASIGARFEEPLTRGAQATPEWLNAADAAPDPADMPGTAAVPSWLTAAAPATETPGAQPAESLPDWLTELGQPDAPLTPEAVPDADLPAWLTGATSPLASEDVPDWMQAADPAEAAAHAHDETMPGWLAAAQDLPAAPEAPGEVWGAENLAAPTDDPVPAPDSDLPEWLRGAPPAPSLGDDLPDWLRATTGSLPEPPAWTSPEPLAPASALPEPEAPEQPAPWLADAEATPAEAAPVVPASLQAATVEAPHDWLDEMAAGAAPELAAADAPAATEVPAEVERLAEAPPPGELEPAAFEMAVPGATAEAEAEATPVEPPDWLPAAAAAATAAPAAPTEEAALLAEAGVPDWLQGAAPASPAEELPPWLQDNEAAMAIGTEAAEPAEEGAVAAPMDDLPPWLREAAAHAPAEGETLPWLAAVPAPEETLAPLEPAPAAPESPADGNRPTWLAAASPAEEVPAWLQPGAALDADPPAAELMPPSAAAPPEPVAFDPMAAAAEADALAASQEAAAAAVPAAELPDWLRDLIDDTEDTRTAQWEAAADAEFGQELPGAQDEPDEEEPEQPLPEGIPDWMQAMAASAPAPDSEPAAEVTAPAAPEAPPPTAELELPDFLQLASPEAIARAQAPFEDDAPEAAEPAVMASLDDSEAIAPADLPDWLQAMAPENLATAPAPAFDSDIMAAAAAGLNLDEAPDWLQAAQPGATAGLGDLDLGAPPELPPAAEAPALDLNLDDAPDWLQAAAALPAAEASSGDETEAPAWLSAEPAMPADADLPPWAQPEAPGPTDTVINFLRAKETPDWLTELRDDAAQPEPAEPPPAALAAPAADMPSPMAEAAEPSLDDMSPDEAMRWLESLALRQGAAADEMVMGEPATYEMAASAADAELGVPEGAAALEPAEASVAENPLPDWLADVEARFEIDPLADTAPRKPATLAEAPTETASLEPSVLPDWLAGLEPLAADTPAELPRDQAATEDEAALWLDEQTERAEALGVPVQGLAGADLLDDAGLAEPNVEALDADEAMAWLEKLAAQQGASADELLSAPEDRPSETPAWIAAQQAADAEAPLAAGETPDWLADLRAAEDANEPLEPAVLPEWLQPAAAEAALADTSEAPAAEAAISGPDFASMDAEAAMAWLEGLAAQQGADPNELQTAPETRPSEAPAWVAAEQAAAAELPVEPPTEPEAAPQPEPVVVPAELAAPEPPSAEATPPAAPAETGEPAEPDVDRLSRLADRLAASRRAKEAEIEARFAQQRAEQEEARRLVWEAMQTKKAAIESIAEPAAPAAEAPPAPEPEPVVAQAVPTAPAQPAATPPLRALPDESAWTVRAPRARPPSRYAGQPAESVLAEAQARLRQQDEAGAAEALAHLVDEDQLPNELLAELEGAAPTASVPLLRVLGDAYARRNRLDDALETYRRALRRL